MRDKILTPLALLAFLAAALPLPAFAAETPLGGTLSVTWENDMFYSVDRHYTNGGNITWVPGREVPPPGWLLKPARLLPWFPGEGEIRHGYALGHSMFTPGDLGNPDPPLTERPYAGWLYVTAGLGIKTDRQIDHFWMTAGIVGPASLAEQAQETVHRIAGTDMPRGWDTQLGNEPGFILGWQRSWRELARATVLGNALDVSPHAGGSLGNVFTYANAGVTLRYGSRLPDDLGPPRIQPGNTGGGDFSPVSGFRWYLFAGVEGRAVARNIFLDGNTFRESRSVDKKPFVGDLQFGLVLDWNAVRLSYTHIQRSREFETQDGNDEFGAMTVSVKF